MTKKRPPRVPAANDPSPPGDGELLKPVYVGRLRTIGDWERQISKIYREMRQKKLRSDEGTKLVYVARTAVEIVKMREELQVLRGMAHALDQPESTVTLLPAPVIEAAIVQDVGEPEPVLVKGEGES